jgi:hypothetical protein
MAKATCELQGYTVVLNKIAFITRVFEAEAGEGFQFNIRFAADVRLTPKYPTREEAELHRKLLVTALEQAQGPG